MVGSRAGFASPEQCESGTSFQAYRHARGARNDRRPIAASAKKFSQSATSWLESLDSKVDRLGGFCFRRPCHSARRRTLAPRSRTRSARPRSSVTTDHCLAAGPPGSMPTMTSSAVLEPGVDDGHPARGSRVPERRPGGGPSKTTVTDMVSWRVISRTCFRTADRLR